MGVPRFRPGDAASTLTSVPRYLVESYVAASAGEFDAACERARRTAAVGAGVTYVHSTFVPTDETVLHLFDAPSAKTLDAAGRLAGLEFERIVEAIGEIADKRKENGR